MGASQKQAEMPQSIALAVMGEKQLFQPQEMGNSKFILLCLALSDLWSHSKDLGKQNYSRIRSKSRVQDAYFHIFLLLSDPCLQCYRQWPLPCKANR